MAGCLFDIMPIRLLFLYNIISQFLVWRSNHNYNTNHIHDDLTLTLVNCVIRLIHDRCHSGAGKKMVGHSEMKLWTLMNWNYSARDQWGGIKQRS